MLPHPSPHSAAPSFSHLNAAERRQIAFRSRYLFLGAILILISIIMIAFVVNVGSSLLYPQETRYSTRAARPNLAALLTPRNFNADSEITSRNATAPLQQPHVLQATLVPPPIANIITTLGPSEIALLVQDLDETLSPHSVKLQANKITGAIVLECACDCSAILFLLLSFISHHSNQDSTAHDAWTSCFQARSSRHCPLVVYSFH